MGTESLRACAYPQKLCSRVRNTALGLVLWSWKCVPSPSVENGMGPEMNRLFQLNRRREVGGGKDRRGRGRKHTEREEIKEQKKQ